MRFADRHFEEIAMHTLDLWSMLFVFMLATFVGFQVIQNVSPAAAHAADVADQRDLGHRDRRLDHHRGRGEDASSARCSGAIAVAASMTNIVSGFLITDRMLKMFREKGQQR